MPIGSLDVLRKLTIGVELQCDLSQPLSAVEQRRLRELFQQHCLLLFRKQQLTHEQQVQVLGYLGAVLRASDGIGYVSNDSMKGSLGTGELAFHSDLSFTPCPYKAISLLAVEVVDGQSATRFADGIKACAALPESLRRRLASLRSLSVMPSNMATDRFDEEVSPSLAQHWRPVLEIHPDIGAQILYVSQQHTACIDGLGKAESKALIKELFEYLYAPDNVYEHAWYTGDFVIWDNLALQHARGHLRASGPRTLQRVVIGDRSFYDLCPQYRADGPEYLQWLDAADRPATDGTLASVAQRATTAGGK